MIIATSMLWLELSYERFHFIQRLSSKNTVEFWSVHTGCTTELYLGILRSLCGYMHVFACMHAFGLYPQIYNLKDCITCEFMYSGVLVHLDIY